MQCISAKLPKKCNKEVKIDKNIKNPKPEIEVDIGILNNPIPKVVLSRVTKSKKDDIF